MSRTPLSFTLAVLLLGGVPLATGNGRAHSAQQESGDTGAREDPLQREKRLHAEQLQSLREHAAQAIEGNAAALEAAADEFERIALDATAAAKEAGGEENAAAVRLERIATAARSAAKAARTSAETARRAAEAARRRANRAAATTRRINGGKGRPTTGSSTGDPADARPADDGKPKTTGSIRTLNESDKHAAAKRTAKQNKDFYLEAKRAKRGRGRQRIEKTLTYSPGEAPDMADLDIYAEWQWGVNVARGSASFSGGAANGARKSGDIDIARVSFQPSPDKMAATGMKWGMRRYNLGDVTVVDCDFTGIPKEHGIYDNLAGHGLYQGNTFKNIGGQALQIAYRDRAYSQYQPDNLPFTGKTTIIVDDCHAVDCGLDPSRSAFTWTFFDPGTRKFPATVILRNCTMVHAWARCRTAGGKKVRESHPRAMRSPGGLMLTQIQHVNGKARRKPTETLVIDNCLFDMSVSGMPVAAVRGVGTILIEDSCFIARDHRNPHFDVDDEPDRPSGKVILENCVSPEGARVWLRIRKQRVVSLHCPGKRLEIDVKTLEITELEPRDDPITRLISPLAGRTVRAGIHDPFRNANPDIGTVPFRYRDAPAVDGR